ncbi:MAG: signal peptide peptidase SppA [Candidatus Poribacteria bacterium]|nr:signal peptide peptidase SppA [Candidatus Poribacteria bacterium]
MNRSVKITLIIIAAVIAFLVIFGRLFIRGGEGMGDKIAIVEIKGTIIDSEEIIAQIHQHRDNGSVKALVLRIDSPGGGVAPVQEIFGELKKINQPIVASMGSAAASGGYYLACAAEQIYANPGTLTGSIGVVMQFIKLKDLYQKIGVEYQVVKSGEHKDIGNPQREMTQEERDLLQATIDDVRLQFIEAILQSRKDLISQEEIESLADGRIFSGQQAFRHKLVDHLGNLPDAILAAGRLANITGQPKTTQIKQKPSLLEQLLDIRGLLGLSTLQMTPSVSLRYEANISALSVIN